LEHLVKQHTGSADATITKGEQKMDNSLEQKMDTLIHEAMSDGLVPGLSVVIVNHDGTQYAKGFGSANLETVLPDGETGELVVSGGVMMQGYWNRPEDTARALRTWDEITSRFPKQPRAIQ
jgi:acyl-CoA synthetase (AMP-forming)/AMP-acid ligase II